MTRLIDQHTPQVIEQLAELALKVSANKDTRKGFLDAVKKVEPNMRFPSQEVDDLRSEMTEREENSKLEREREKTEQRLTAQRQKLIDSRGFTEESIKEVEEVMTKYGITDYEAGADLYAARKPAAPPPEASGTWDFPTIGNTSIPDLIANPVKAARDEAFKVISEIKRGRAA